MRPLLRVLLFTALSSALSCSSVPRKPASEPADDPHLWLEEVESTSALGWVRSHNAKSVSALKANPLYPGFESEIRNILLAKDRIPYPTLRNGWIYNFWQDARHVKGILRRTPISDYSRGPAREAKWETLLDVDSLAKKEKESWVYKGSVCLAPEYERCLLKLSRGGKDAVVIREFDVRTRSFVAGGFRLPEAKSDIAWLDRDTLLVGTDFGPDSLTRSGYPRIVKKWKRGTPLAKAQMIFQGETSDVSVSAWTTFRPEGHSAFISRSVSFFEEETFLLGTNGSLTRLPFPRDVSFRGVFQGQLLALLRKEWRTATHHFPEGTLISLPLFRISDAHPEAFIEVVFAPDERSSISGVSLAKSSLFLDILDNVKGRTLQFSRTGSGWTYQKLEFPDHGAVSVSSTDDFDDRIFAVYESFMVPTSIYLFDGTLKVVKTLPPRFHSDDLVAEQFEAVGKDGTKIPYFLVHKKNIRLDGSNPTLLYGYGGFEVSMTPYYSGTLGKIWLERGGVYALANIRGGGEFGPKWHQAALRENRQVSFDDFIAIAEDMVARKLTSPRHLAIRGGSNGGLLVGAVFVQRPELFNGAVCEVPLLDMLRFHKLLAGNSWIGEYGDPEDAKMSEVLLKYSPYHNVHAGTKYPLALFMTSTKDDRVHPGHARKMVARMEELGHDVLYFENVEGGHGGAADLEQRIQMTALQYTYLFTRVMQVMRLSP